MAKSGLGGHFLTPGHIGVSAISDPLILIIFVTCVTYASEQVSRCSFFQKWPKVVKKGHFGLDHFLAIFDIQKRGEIGIKMPKKG